MAAGANELNRKCDEQKQLLEKPRAEEAAFGELSEKILGFGAASKCQVEVVKKVDNEATLEELKQLKDSARPSEISSVHSPSYRCFSGAQAADGTGGPGAGLWQPIDANGAGRCGSRFCRARQDGCESSWTSSLRPSPCRQDFAESKT